MSTEDLRGPRARVDRWAPRRWARRFGSLCAARRAKVAALLIVPLGLVPVVWLDDDHGQAMSAMLHVGVTEGGRTVELPLHVNARVERWIEAYQTTHRGEFQDLLARRGVFSDLIHGKLRERDMPEDLLYLAMIESGLLPGAVSHVSAVGLWQLMDGTARQFGLRVDEFVDERRDPVRATDAALDYLKWLRQRYGSWYLAVAAYNAGPGRLERILERHADGRTGDENLYWEVLRHLPRETREYVPRLVAATLIGNDAEALGFDGTQAPAYEYDMVFVPGDTELWDVALSLDVGMDVLDGLNPHLIRGVTPPGEIYEVRVPRGRTSQVMAALTSRPMSERAD